MTTKPTPSANQSGPGSPTADGRIWWTDVPGSVPSGYYIDPDPNQAEKDAAAREDHAESVADMVPGKWNETHLIASALMSSPPLQGDPYVKGMKALTDSTGEPEATAGTPPKAAKALSEVSGEPMVGAVSNVRTGMTIAEAFQNQVKSNVSNPNFTRDELATASSYPPSWGQPNSSSHK